MKYPCQHDRPLPDPCVDCPLEIDARLLMRSGISDPRCPHSHVDRPYHHYQGQGGKPCEGRR